MKWNPQTYSWQVTYLDKTHAVTCKELGLIYDQWSEAISLPFALNWWQKRKRELDYDLVHAPSAEVSPGHSGNVEAMYTIKAYCAKANIPHHLRMASVHGRNMAKLCRDRDLPIGKQVESLSRPDYPQATVNTYPESALRDYFFTPKFDPSKITGLPFVNARRPDTSKVSVGPS